MNPGIVRAPRGHCVALSLWSSAQTRGGSGHLLDHLRHSDLGIFLKCVHHEAIAPDVIHTLESERGPPGQSLRLRSETQAQRRFCRARLRRPRPDARSKGVVQARAGSTHSIPWVLMRSQVPSSVTFWGCTRLPWALVSLPAKWG